MTINVAYSSSEYYFKPSMVSIYSLLKNTNSEVHIFFLSSQVSRKNKLILENLVGKYGAKLTIIEIEEKLEAFAKDLNLPLMRGNYSTYARILLPQILIDVEDVLLIDSDTLIVKDIKTLYGFISSDKVLNATRDYVVSNVHSRHEDPFLSSMPYFNMGVLHINLTAWRSADMSKILIDSFDKKQKLKIADQTIINKYLREHIGELPLSCNLYTYFHYNLSYFDYRKLNNQTDFCDEHEFDEAIKEPIIVHFIGTWYERPWFIENYSHKKELYRSYWNDVFSNEDYFEVPQRSLVSWVYDFLSISILKYLGFKEYFWFRYNLVQKLKIFK